jgi:hypothetical protein
VNSVKGRHHCQKKAQSKIPRKSTKVVEKQASKKNFFLVFNLHCRINRVVHGGFLVKSILHPASRFILFLSLIIGTNALAALGEQATTIIADSGKLSAKQKNANVFSSYSVQELTSDANTIKEFVDHNGIIFAISWRGIDNPDLSIILGSYYAGYKADEAAKPKVNGRHEFEIKRENLVVQKWGNMRSLRGRAYDPSLIPAGVSVNELQ